MKLSRCWRRQPWSALALIELLLFCAAFPVAGAPARRSRPAPPPPPTTAGLSGWFSLLWQDPAPGEAALPGPIPLLTDDQGRAHRLVFPEGLAEKLGGIQSLDQHRFTVQGAWVDRPGDAITVNGMQEVALPFRDETLSAAGMVAPVVKPYALILCRFSDTTGVTPHPPSWYAGLMSDAFPGATHFWQEASYGNVVFTGSTVFGWYNLPRPRSYYLNSSGTLMDTQRVLNDALAVANPDVNFADFAGMNIFLNDNLGGAAYGTSGMYASLDGVTRTWGVTWLPLWGHNPGILGHEMGHSLGLPHSSGPYKETYDSRWDVMSGGAYGNSKTADAVYGTTPTHPIAWHKDKLGFIPAKRKLIAKPGTDTTIHLTRLSQPPSEDDYLMAQIFIGGWGSRFYTVELRQLSGYDAVGGLPGEAVVIHKVDSTLSDRNAQVVDADGNGNTNDEGAMWKPGETFQDSANGITIAVESATATGMSVKITVGSDVPLPEIVSHSGDTGPGSLRNAINYANVIPGTAIQLNVPPSDTNYAGGVVTVQPTASLPVIRGEGTVLDGGTQLARTGDIASGRPPLVLNGARAGTYGIGLQLGGGNCLIRGLTINGFGGYGIVISGSAAVGNRVEGCFIGVNATGTAALPNAGVGIFVDSGATRNVIGGTTPEARNVISGNAIYGLALYGPGTDRNLVQGNFFGTDVTGTLPIPNGSFAVLTYAGARANTIGGTVPGAANLISGNRGYGLIFHGAGTEANVAQGNLIGTDVTGRAALPNAFYGVLVYGGAKGNFVGGPAAGAGNVIAGNGDHGISVQGAGTTGTTVQGNLVGTDRTGLVALPNAGDGVELGFATQNNLIGGSTPGARNVISGNRGSGVSLVNANTRGNFVRGNAIGTDATGLLRLGNVGSGIAISSGASGNAIGGVIPAEGNLIAFNGAAGILVRDAGTVGNSLRGNTIHHSGTLAIQLSGGSEDVYGVTANDPGDTDSGPNNLQNHPVIDSVTFENGETVITGSISSSGGATFAIDFYANAEVPPSGFGEGTRYLGSTSVSTDVSGTLSFVFRVPAALADQYLTATATNVTTGDTSEFGQARRGS